MRMVIGLPAGGSTDLCSSNRGSTRNLRKFDRS